MGADSIDRDCDKGRECNRHKVHSHVADNVISNKSTTPTHTTIESVVSRCSE